MNRYFKKTIFLFSVFCFLFSVFAFSANIVFAQSGSIIEDAPQGEVNCSDPNLSQEAKHYCGDYELNDFVRIFEKYYNRTFGLIGSIALLFFIYGGVMFLISGGNQERVSQAKNIIIGSVIGIVIIFTSYMIINFVAVALGVIEPGESILQSDWFK